MKALTWHGTHDTRIAPHPGPRIEGPEDGFVAPMEPGDSLSHELTGDVVKVGGAVTKFKRGGAPSWSRTRSSAATRRGQQVLPRRAGRLHQCGDNAITFTRVRTHGANAVRPRACYGV